MDPEDLLVLLNGKFSSLTIGFNDNHAPGYSTAQEYHEKCGQYSGRDDDSISWVSEIERMMAITHNSVWTIQWYPDTPVGFCCVGASTFEAAFRYAMESVDEIS